ncbi:hypothetical protein FS749_000843 [Ceratobasidium sp. UAMH 11750]|nr:hypothetical protein FS749_000843 [Ceratobasidium sp. UAMH 11750]
MISVLAGIRYALFALYIIYSGVLVTAGAWHLGLANTIGASAQLDAFVVFLGAFGLLFILAVTFIDTLRKHAVTSTVWFELAWLGLFWVFYLAAASAATAIGPSTFCGIQGVDVLGWRDACAAIKVIIAFTWIGTFTFLVHMFTLLVLSLLHAPQSPGVWHSGVRDFPWMDFTARPSFRTSVSARVGVRMGSEPSSPAKYHYERRMTPAQPALAPVSVPAQSAPAAPIHARMTNREDLPHVAHPFAAVAVTRPPPARERESAQVYQYKPERSPRAKTQSQAIVEQFRSNQVKGNRSSSQVQSTVVRALPKVPQAESQGIRPLQLVRKLPEPQQQQQSLYPVYVASTMTPSHSSSISYNREPQPLGEWPRRNPPSDPRRQRNAAPPAFERYAANFPSAGPMTASGAQERVARRSSADSYGSSGGSVDSDGVARRRDGRPKHRPPPLDFSKLNAGRQ